MTLTPEQVSSAYCWLTLLIDVGLYLANSDVCIANLDEELDPGVLIELMYAKMMGIPIVGFRTETRTPYGRPETCNKGMHIFPYFICDKYITYPNANIRTKESAEIVLDELAEVILEQTKVVIENKKPKQADEEA